MPVLNQPLRAGSRQIWLRVGAPILGLVFAIIAGALALLWHLAERQDRDWVKSSQELVDSAVAGNARALSNTTLDFAFWNDAYRATSLGWDRTWLSKNYFSSIADGVVVFSDDRQIKYIWFAQPAERAAKSAAAAVVVENAGSKDELVKAAAATKAAGMMLNRTTVQDGQLMLISTAPISWETEKERLAGRLPGPVNYFAATDIIDAAEWARIGGALGLDGLTFRQNALNAHESSALVWSPVRDSAGNVLGGLAWQNKRPGTSRFSKEVWPIAFALLFAGALTILVARHLVAHQLQVMAHAEAVIESSRLKSEFIATMSHELRTPLNAIIGYSELIHEQSDGDTNKDKDAREDADKIGAAARHLLRLINEILDHARIDAGHAHLEAERLDVSHLLTEVFDVVEPLALARGNVMRVGVEADARFVIADPARLSQCLLKLAGNAAKFTQNGTIEINARRIVQGAQHYISFDVSDTGIGIEAAALEKLFVPFSQADASESRVYDGAGLGLSIVRRLARAMGGDVSATSTPGEGSRFSLLIPAADRIRRAA